jgi:hypothetical protein
MTQCPHCHLAYDEDNDTQPCCGSCGHPITCECNDEQGGGSDIDFDFDEE